MVDENIVAVLKARALEIFAKWDDAIETMDELSEWDSIAEVIDNVKTMTQFLGFVAAAVAEAAEDVLETVTNEEKLEAAAQALDDLIKLPWFFEDVDGPIIKWLISNAYQVIVKKVF